MSDYMKKEYKLPNGRTVTADFNELGCAMVTIQAMDALFDILNSSEQQWIPCSERLPEEFYVLCCDNHGEMLIANLFECDDSDTGFSAESEDCYMYNCVAWMPLPEPYKGEET